MTLSSILLFTAFAVLFRLLARPAWKGWILYAASILAVYWLQPATPVRYLDFWFPTLTLGMAALGWALTRPAYRPAAAKPAADAAPVKPRPDPAAGVALSLRANLPAAGVLAGLVLLVGLTRYLEFGGLIGPSRPPVFEQVVVAVVIIAGLALGLGFLVGRGADAKKAPAGLLWAAIVVLLLLLVLLKTPPLALSVSVAVRNLMNQGTVLAAAGDLRWLGFSYVAFRLISTLRERQNGRLPAVSLQEYLVYVLFFPAFTAGPIDRLDRFIKDLRGEKLQARPGTAGQEARPTGVESASAAGITAPAAPALLLPQAWPEWAGAGQRLTLGLFKKFVLADGLALMALNATNASQVNSAGWAWALLIAYSLQIYFDFSGYTDIAIGVGRLLGINLPENFNAPYLRANLTLFWNNWHMTLTNWFRAYYFNPVSRWLRTLKNVPRLLRQPASGDAAEGEEPAGVSMVLILLVTQLTTFVLVGLWHGVTWNFVLWGAWHGLGLFAQNRWTDAMRPRYAALESRPRLVQFITGFSTLLTFIYVSLGWVFFALPDPALSFRVLGKLLGF